MVLVQAELALAGLLPAFAQSASVWSVTVEPTVRLHPNTAVRDESRQDLVGQAVGDHAP
jgi:hypothetical protein